MTKFNEVSLLNVVKKKYINFIVGVLISAIAFNIFILPYDVVFGVSGVSVILYKIFHIETYITILIANTLLLVASIVFLGKQTTKATIIGSLLYPLFIKLTQFITSYIDIQNTEPIVMVIFGAVISGFGSGLIFKEGFTTGGTDILKQIISKYKKVSLGKSSLYVEGIIITFGVFVFGMQSFIYSVISLYVVSILTDKVVLGISSYKTFHIVTKKEKEVKKYLMHKLSRGITLLEGTTGFTKDERNVIMCTMPTREYTKAKEIISEIDPDAYFIVTDAYEAKGVY